MENIYLIRKTVQHMAKLMEILVNKQCQRQGRCHVVALLDPGPASGDSRDGHTENDLMTIKEAAATLNVSRYTVDAMRQRGELTTIRRNGRVRLKRHEVADARQWYAVKKGKV